MRAGDEARGSHRGAGRPVLLAGWVVLLVLAVGMLHTLGRGPLAAPPVTRPGALPGWLDQRSAATLAFCTLRLAAMGSAGYLLATTLAGLMSRMVGWARCSTLLDAISPLVVRRLVQGAAGLTFAATVSTTQPPAWAATGVPAGPTSPTPIMRRLPATAPPATAPPATAPPATAPPATAPPATAPPLTAPPAQAAGATWVIRPGDNLWSVAEATLARAWGRVPSDAEVDDYWTGLIAVNRSRLAHRDDPDLVFPGQVFVLPAPSPAGQP